MSWLIGILEKVFSYWVNLLVTIAFLRLFFFIDINLISVEVLLINWQQKGRIYQLKIYVSNLFFIFILIFMFTFHWQFWPSGFGRWLVTSGTEWRSPFEDMRFKLFINFFPIGGESCVIIEFGGVFVLIEGSFFMTDFGNGTIHRVKRHGLIGSFVLLILMHFYTWNLSNWWFVYLID